MLFILSIDANEKSINFPSNKGFFKHSQISMPVAVLWKTKKTPSVVEDSNVGVNYGNHA